MAPLARIEIKGFKSIQEAAIDLQPLNVLIGPNGAGKSNLVSVFELVRHIAERHLQTYVARQGGANALLHYGRATTDRIELSLSFHQGQSDAWNGYRCRLEPTVRDTLIFGAEQTLFHDRSKYSEPYKRDLGTGHEETRLEHSTRGQHRQVADYVLTTMSSWRVYHFHDTSPSAKIKATGDLNDNAVLRDDASNLAAYLYLLRQQHRAEYDSIVATIRSVAPFFDDFALRPDPLNEGKIRLEWRDRLSDAYFDASSLSDGTLRFMCLATLFLMPNPPDTIIVDEPELGLHPYAIAVLAAMMHSAASRTQVIVSTQSVTLVNQCAPEDIIVTERSDGHSVFRRLQSTELADWLQDYGLGELWEKNLLGGRPR